MPNSVSAVPVSKSLFRGTRRLFAYGQVWTGTQCTIVDNAATAPDGTSSASTLSGTTSNWRLGLNTNANISAGTYTIACNVKRNTGTDQVFAFTKDGTITRSPVHTATADWQRFSYTFTLAAPANAGTPMLCSSNGGTAANLQICDLELYAGSADLGPQTYAGHFYKGSFAHDALGVYGSGAIDFSDGGLGFIQFPTATAYSELTVIAAVQKMTDGQGNNAILSYPPSFTQFTAAEEQGGNISNNLGGTNSTTTSLWNPFGQGWHMMTVRASATEMGHWLDDIPIFTQTLAHTAPSIADIWVNLVATKGLFGRYKVAAIALYDRALTRSEIEAAYSVLTTRLAVSGNVMAAARVLVAEGDSITAATNGYTIIYNSAPPNPRLIGVNTATGGATIATFQSRAAALDAKLPTNRNGRKFILTVLAGNGLNTGGAAQYAADLASYLDARRAAGWTVGVGTLLPRTSAGFNTERALVNAEIAGWAGVHADFIIPFAADPTMGPDAAASNTSLYSDGTHPTVTGHGHLATVYATAVNVA